MTIYPPPPAEPNRDPIAVARVLLLVLRQYPVLLEAVHEPLVLEALADAIGAGEPITYTEGALGYMVTRELGDLARLIAKIQPAPCRCGDGRCPAHGYGCSDCADVLAERHVCGAVLAAVAKVQAV